MTNEEIATRVAAKLTGEFYVGQRVRVRPGRIGQGCAATITEMYVDETIGLRVRLEPPPDTVGSPFWPAGSLRAL